MNKMFFLIVAAAVSVSAHAQDRTGQPAPRYDNLTVDTGTSMPVDMPVSSCSQPPTTPERAEYLFVESKFTYFTCAQVKNATFAVTGSFWNANMSEVQGTAKISWQLKKTSGGGSDSINAGTDTNSQPNAISPDRYSKAVISAVGKCERIKLIVTQSQKPLASTPCAGQSPSSY